MSELQCGVCGCRCTDDDVRTACMGEPADVVCTSCWNPNAHDLDELIEEYKKRGE
jgi:hypothetical protein